MVEGLAQHYTMLVTKRIASQLPNALPAYRGLLACQPPVYQTQVAWESEFTAEHMRLALIRTRRSQEGVTLEKFAAALASALASALAQLPRRSGRGWRFRLGDGGFDAGESDAGVRSLPTSGAYSRARYGAPGVVAG